MQRGTHNELSVVSVSVRVCEGALAVHLPGQPHAVVAGPVAVLVHAAALHLALHPLALVLLLHQPAALPRGVGAVRHRAAPVLPRQHITSHHI